MPKVSDAARTPVYPAGSVPGLGGGSLGRSRRRAVAALAGPGVAAARDVYTRVPSDVVRVAALVEIAAAAAALARTVVKLRHLDPELIAPHVSDRADMRAVLGRGSWLPTMVGHVPAPDGLADVAAVLSALAPPATSGPVSRARRGRRAPAGQGALFGLSSVEG